MIIIAFGSNLSGVFGTPKNTIRRALDELAAVGIQIVETSGIYITRAYSYAPQPEFSNAVATVATPMSADALLQVLKRIEAQAGRRVAKNKRQLYGRWAARPLDLDIVCYKGIVCNWKITGPIEGERVVLPHPRAHERAFVLVPLAEAAPHWHHPILGLTATQLLKRPDVLQTGAIISREDFAP
jgi:2-amino-4-hydroxy-6-hydroxymethyldihydropteridine diphosphokinase